MFSEVERCCYGRHQLVEVMCQLRYPAILKIESQPPYEFQELIRGDYPNYSMREEQVPPPPGAKPSNPPIMARNHQFLSLDGGWKVNLTRDFVALSTRRYTQWEDFAKRLDRILAHLINVYHPACFNRIGLRYINAISKKQLDLEDTPWRELIAPAFLGIMGEEELPEQTFQKAEQSVTLALPGGCRSNIKCGRGTMRKVHNKTRAVTEEPVYMLDLDIYMEGNNALSHVAPSLNVVHTHADSIFRAAITDTLHEAMEPRTI